MHHVPAITGMSGFGDAVIGRLSERRIRNGDSSNRLEHQSFHLSAFLSAASRCIGWRTRPLPVATIPGRINAGQPTRVFRGSEFGAADGFLPSLALRTSAVAPV